VTPEPRPLGRHVTADTAAAPGGVPSERRDAPSTAPADTGAPGGPSPVRDWWVVTGMSVAAASATLASFSGLRGLAALAGWPDRLSWLLPVTLDAYAMTSARVWLAATTRSGAARRFARANALGAIAASITGNAAYHAVHAGLLHVTWPIVVLVGAVPAAVLGLTAHLHALRTRTEPPPRTTTRPPRTRPAPTPPAAPDTPAQPPGRRTSRPPRGRDDGELWAAAVAADAQHRQAHGQPITRDALRAALRVSGPRATELRRRLAQDGTDPAALPDPAQEPRA
jgi:hypothetical protein